MAKQTLKFNDRLQKDLKHLLFDILFTEKTFMELKREYFQVDGKPFFTNLQKFDFNVIKKAGTNKEVITNKDLDSIFELFFRHIRIKPLEKKSLDKISKSKKTKK